MTTNDTLAPDRNPQLDDSIDLFEILTLFVVEWRTLLLAGTIVMALCTAIIYSITPLYEASSSLLPQNKDDSTNLASFFSGRSPGDVFIGLLASRSVQDDVIDRANLMEYYKTTSRESARNKLSSRSVFSVGKDTLVVIKIRDESSEAAQRIANAYLEGLEAQRSRMLQHAADIHNRFFEQQLARQSDALSAAEQDLKKTQESTGIVQMDAQTNSGIAAIANVRAQVTALKVQLAALLLGEADQNPQVKALRAQIAQLEGQQQALESSASGTPGAAAGAKGMPGVNLEYARKLREVRYHEALFSSISTQYEAAKLSEGYSGAPFVIIDRAVAPADRAWPPRRLMLIAAFAASIFAAVVLVALRMLWRRIAVDPAQAPRLQAIRASFRSQPKQA